MTCTNWDERRTAVQNNMKQCKKCNIKLPFSNIFPADVCSKIDGYYTCSICKNILEAMKQEQEMVFEHDREREEFYFIKTNPYPTYKVIVNELLKTKEEKEFYTKETHKEMKEAYEKNYIRGFGFNVLYHKYINRYHEEYFMNIANWCLEKKKDEFFNMINRDDLNEYIENKIKIRKNICKYILKYLESKKNKTKQALYNNKIPNLLLKKMTLPELTWSIRVDEYHYNYLWGKFFRETYKYTKTSIKAKSNKQLNDYLKTNDFE